MNGDKTRVKIVIPENITLNINVNVLLPEGSQPVDLTPVLARLDQMETAMTAQTEALQQALQGVSSRVQEDFDHLRNLLEQALATRTEDQAEIARLRAEADEVNTSIQGTVDTLNSIDPDASFPGAPDQPADPDAPVEG